MKSILKLPEKEKRQKPKRNDMKEKRVE